MEPNFTWQELGTEYLYHGTNRENAEAAVRQGFVKAPSYWGTQRIAGYYADWVTDFEGGDSGDMAIIRVPMARFRSSGFQVDNPSVQEPISWTLGKKEEALFKLWGRSKKTWQDCLRIFESVRYRYPVKVTEDDVI